MLEANYLPRKILMHFKKMLIIGSILLTLLSSNAFAERNCTQNGLKVTPDITKLCVLYFKSLIQINDKKLIASANRQLAINKVPGQVKYLYIKVQKKTYDNQQFVVLLNNTYIYQLSPNLTKNIIKNAGKK